jgi:hypothetical protein
MHREGFEPSKGEARQIYSLVHLTALPPVLKSFYGRWNASVMIRMGKIRAFEATDKIEPKEQGNTDRCVILAFFPLERGSHEKFCCEFKLLIDTAPSSLYNEWAFRRRTGKVIEKTNSAILHPCRFSEKQGSHEKKTEFPASAA